MALSAFFLMVFLLQHFIINAMSLVADGGKTFNNISHFMGTNPLIQYLLQPILIFGVVFHLIMGIILEIKNQKARNAGYVKNSGAANSSWVSRNMIYTGIAILFFMALHFVDFWFPEIHTKFIQGDWSGLHHGEFRYFYELQYKFKNPVRVTIYVVAFVFLSLHLLHGFNSAFQSVGINNKYTKGIKRVGKIYAIGIPLGFIVIALFHFCHWYCR